MSIMSETAVQTTELASQYSAQVAGDLDRNVKEQERLSAEIEALQQQLAALQNDHTILVNLQQALGTPAAPAAEPVTAVPVPRKKAATASATAKKAAPVKKRAGKNAAAGSAPQSASPTLVDLVRKHLADQHEPRSAAEITTALGQQHPERTVKTTVIRTTLEGLVAKAQALRTKQGTSVFYTATETAPLAAGDQVSAQSA
ncbi:hypothetical protein [Streptomyces sp. NPDC048643]|uniref:hypothetical protein n=1 Tax=Streptomyces sp. NPDC048643 TaxID=3155637 RepID=UPI003443CB54